MCQRRFNISPELIVKNSKIRAAIPILPLCWAVTCFFFNAFLPGSGTILSGIFCFCCGRSRFSETCNGDDRFLAFVINVLVGLAQFCTVILCLVGWCWSVGWGITMMSISKKNSTYIRNLQESVSRTNN